MYQPIVARGPGRAVAAGVAGGHGPR